jgi:catechol 2,3-dioxygenase-like lactoylglutathione lyase family enzyme
MTVRPDSLDHVALWVADRDRLSDFLCDHLGMHVIERTDTFTLVGADALRGKLTLFAAEGPREPGALRQVVLRVADLEAALGSLPDHLEVSRENGVAGFDAPEGLRLGLVEAEQGVDYDLDHVVLGVSDTDAATERLGELGFSRHDGRLAVADRHLRLEPGSGAEGERPLLNHLALLVESADAAGTEAERRGAEVADVVDAPNTRAVFVWGPDRIKLEYVEHKPGFSLT